jgi:crotonobetainyl-CoA:carnitine CoA-transferase CaiB-like acyl-CoA transferase
VTDAPTTRCLAGIRVLDLSQYLPGPYAAQILADLGAEVVKVEPPSGDPMRGIGPRDKDGVSAFYKLINAGKTVIRLDLKTEEDRDGLAALVRGADALIESFRPGALARRGFGAEALRTLNPRLVHCALSGFGQTGPYARRAGHDVNYMALGGGLATSGTAERPVNAHPPTADYASGMQAALTVIAGLLRRERTGVGATVDVSMSETVLGWQALILTAARRPGHEPERGRALLNGGAACYRVYETADGRFVTLGALEERFWANFCRAVGRADWIGRQWEPLPQERLAAEVGALFAARPRDAWVAALADADCCFQPILDPADVPSDPHLKGRGLLRASDGDDPLVEVLFPAIFDGTPPSARPPAAEAPADRVLAAWSAA